MPTQGPVISPMEEIGTQTGTVSPWLNSFIALNPSAPSTHLPSQTSATRLSPTVWDYFPACGKENSSASNSMPFLDLNSWQPTKCRPKQSNLRGACHSWITSPLPLVSFFVTIANKLCMDSKSRPRHSSFSEPFASSLQDPPGWGGCGCSCVNESTSKVT